MVEEMYCQKNWDFFCQLCIYVLGDWAKNTIIPGAQSLIDVIWASAELCSPSGSRLSIQAISRDSLLSGGSLHLGCSPLLLSIFGSTGIILCYCLRLPPSLQWCAGKCLTTTSGWRVVLICSACQLRGCKYSHCGRFQATSDLTVSSRNSWRCINQSQPASACHYATHLVTRWTACLPQHLQTRQKSSCPHIPEMNLSISTCSAAQGEEAGPLLQEPPLSMLSHCFFSDSICCQAKEYFSSWWDGFELEVVTSVTQSSS